jgi:DNA helicase II / ATP-dependent DNA helicase PcrA
MFDYLENLNEAQREAVLRTEGPSLIIAGAGSGKTRVLTYRIAHLLKQGVRPSTILALTFTNKAAREMKERIDALVGQKLSRYLWMGTFHSIFARILRIEHEATDFPADFTIYDAADSKSLIKTIIKDFNLDDKIYKPGTVTNRISMAKNNLVTAPAYGQNAAFREYDQSIQMPRISEIYKEYVKRCKTGKAMDFDDLLLITNLLFRNHPDILENYQRRFDYILVDEYQDTNYAQYLIINNLAALHHNISVVGDDAQSIYAFRGARIENILSFQQDYPNHKVFKLEQNYRSTQTIVNAANSVIAHNQRQLRKSVFSEKEIGSRLKLIEALTDNEEGFQVAGIITETQLRDHFRFADYAILYRTNAQSRIFEESLRKRNIPYKIYGGLSFYQRKEIKDLLAYFRMIINPDDNEALKRIINYPVRGIGQTTLTKLEASSAGNEISIWQIIHHDDKQDESGLNTGTRSKLRNFTALIERFRELSLQMSAFDLARTVALETGILKDLYNDKSPEGLSRYRNLEELLNAIQEFTISSGEEGRMTGIGDYLQEVALLTDQDNEKEEDRDKVTLMTVHSAKGLEFKIVFIVGLEKNLFPSVQAGDFLSKEGYEEERRLFYVALTRAKEHVYLTCAGQRYRWGKLEFCHPSPFIREIDPAYLDYSAGESIQFGQKPAFEPQINRKIYFQNGSKAETTPFLKSSFQRKIENIKAESGKETVADGEVISEIVPGMMVEHQRFGVGKVLQVEGVFPDLKATVFFHNAGQKQLLLRFARLRRSDSPDWAD